MAFVLPVVVAAVAGVSIGGTAIGLAMNLKEKMKHTTISVTHLMNLTEGDHISLKRKGDLPFRHAIVVEPVRDPKDKVRVVYHSGAKASARVEYVEIDLFDLARKEELLKHHYEPLITYPGHTVVARATSLCSQYCPTNRRDVLRSYWPFFRDDEHFAVWCQLGFSFGDGMKAGIFPNYTRTLISNVARLTEGDHIMMEDGLSGIVVGIGEKMAQLEVVRFPSEEQRGPGRVVINNTDKIYRLDYDIAVGVNGHTAKDTALCETTEPTEPMPYSNAEEFAIWCKTLQPNLIDCKSASALACARMTGRVRASVTAVDELRPGDHVAFNNGAFYYYQHAIVSHVEGRQIGIIYLVGNVQSASKMAVQSDTIDVSKYLRGEKLCKYFYDVKEWYDPDTVIARASNLIGSVADLLPYKDPQHFAMWCKTGTYQLHW